MEIRLTALVIQWYFIRFVTIIYEEPLNLPSRYSSRVKESSHFKITEPHAQSQLRQFIFLAKEFLAF